MSADRRGPPGRRRHPLIGDGPAVDLALALREVVDKAGLTGKEVYKKTYIAESTQSKALGGRLVPTWPTTWTIAQLDVSADETYWHQLWSAANATKSTSSADQDPPPSSPEPPGGALILNSLVDEVVKRSGLPDWRPLRPAALVTTDAHATLEPVPHSRLRRIAALLVALLVVAQLGGLTVAVVLYVSDRSAYPAVIATLSTDPSPGNVAVSPDGQSAYITTTNNNGTGTVSRIATRTNTTTGRTSAGPSRGIALSPDGRRAYIANSYNNTVSVIDPSNSASIATIPVGVTPIGLAASPDGRHVYVGAYTSDSVSVIDTSTNVVTATLRTGARPFSVSVSPDNRFVYISNDGDHTLSVLDNNTGAVSTIAVGVTPGSVAFSPDSSVAYIVDVARNAVLITEIGSSDISTTIPVGGTPVGIAVSPDGTSIYVTNNADDSVSVIYSSNGTYTGPPSVSDVIPVGDGPSGVAVSPNGDRVYVTNYDSSSVSVIDTGWLAVW